MKDYPFAQFTKAIADPKLQQRFISETRSNKTGSPSTLFRNIFPGHTVPV